MKRKPVILLLFFCAVLLCGRIEWQIYKVNNAASLIGEKGEMLMEEKGEMQEEIERTSASLQQAGIPKTVFLTFDDGPSENTQLILDTLKKYDIKATFFLIGCQAEARKELVQAEIDAGHTVGLHTYCHEASEIYASAESYVNDVLKVKAFLELEFHYTPLVYRFPWGSKNQYVKPFREQILDTLGSEGLTWYDWNVSAEDSVGIPSSYSIIHNIKKDLPNKREAVILMHDSAINKNTAESLPEIIEYIKEQGYIFDVLKGNAGLKG